MSQKTFLEWTRTQSFHALNQVCKVIKEKLDQAIRLFPTQEQNFTCVHLNYQALKRLGLFHDSIQLKLIHSKIGTFPIDIFSWPLLFSTQPPNSPNESFSKAHAWLNDWIQLGHIIANHSFNDLLKPSNLHLIVIANDLALDLMQCASFQCLIATTESTPVL